MSNPLTCRFYAGCFSLMITFAAAWMPSSHAQTRHGAHQAGSVQSDEAAIIHVMKSQFDRPDAPLSVMPVSIDGHVAVAGWIQNATGGRALLKKDNGKWSIHLCAGDALTQVSTLEMAGVDTASARRLAQKVATAERQLPAAEVKKLGLFEGILRIDGGAHHGHGTSHGHAPPARSQH